MATTLPIDKLSLTVDQAVEATGFSRTAIYRAMSAGQLRTFNIGRRRMVSVQALHEFIEKQERQAALNGAAA